MTRPSLPVMLQLLFMMMVAGPKAVGVILFLVSHCLEVNLKPLSTIPFLLFP